MDKVPMTQEGFHALQDELKTLKTVARPTVIQAIAEARAHGDLSENAEYHAAREQQSFIEGRIIELEAVISKAQIIDPSSFSGQTVKFGATVLLVDESTEAEESYTIVGEYETDTEQRKISITAPIARALIGKSVGDSVEVRTPKGLRTYEILEVGFPKGSDEKRKQG
ncbi:MAG: transcription elongation factor GreA [Alphaproteobacteria bacterium]|nr:transcription elongation factor GreA [Alphaproteobacteria bacterium]